MVGIDLTGKKALVMGVTNQRSLGWAIAEKLQQAGAELAFSYQGERLLPELERLTQGFELGGLFACDVTKPREISQLFEQLGEKWNQIDYLVHSIAFAPKAAMEGRYLDTKREDWLLALEISAYSLVAVTQAAEPLLAPGGGLVTLSYYAAEKVVPRYNVMAIAKSALEASVRYLAYELGPKDFRANAISAGAARTVAARSIPGFATLYNHAEKLAPLGRNVTQDEVGNLGLYLLSPLASGITGETVYVDAGYNIMGMEITSQE